MNTGTARLAARPIALSALLGSASLVALTASGAAQAQNQVAAATAPEQVLVTGSLIRGEAPVGPRPRSCFGDDARHALC